MTMMARAFGLAVLLLSLCCAPRAASAGTWDDYNILMWQRHTVPGYRALQTINVNAAMVYAKTGQIDAEGLARVRAAGVPFYLENIATDIFSPYHLAGSNKLYMAAKAEYAADPTNMAAFTRHPSLSDPDAFETLRQRLPHVVQSIAPYRPMFFNLGDEMGIAETSSNWDFDVSPPALAAFRVWLQARYPSLDALNAQWGTQFPRWDAVQPMLTDAALRRADGNYSGWGDFKQWADDAFAGLIRFGTDTLHAADPLAVSALEGAQIPGWGGYDYARLTQTVDLMEIYEYGHNIEIAHAFAPDLILLTTSFKADKAEKRRLWHDVLLGTRGHVIWDENNDFADEDGAIGTRGAELADLFKTLRGGIPAQFIASRSAPAEVAVLSSMPSFRALWLLDRKAERRGTGAKPWTERTMDDDSTQTPWRQSLDSAAEGFAHLGVPVRYLSPEMLAQGVDAGIRLLVLPRSAALSDNEAHAVQAFVARGGLVLADGTPGQFDGHLRQRTTPALAAISGQLIRGEFLQSTNSARLIAELGPVIARAGIHPLLSLTTPSGAPVRDVTARIWRNGAVTLVGLQRDENAADVAENVIVTLASPQHATELFSHAKLGDTGRFVLTLDSALPGIIALSDLELPGLTLTGPTHAAPGEDVRFHLRQPAGPASAPITNVTWRDPTGHPCYDAPGNLKLVNGEADISLHLADGDAQGDYTLSVRDILSGAVIERVVTVRRGFW